MKPRTLLVCGLLALPISRAGAYAAVLSVASVTMQSGAIDRLVVSGSVAGESTFGFVILVEITTRAGNTGTVTFTPAPPVDITQEADAWPGAGTFTPFDTDSSGSVLLNGVIDDDGNFLPAALSFSGALASLPIVASANADGVWDVSLTTPAGASAWEGLASLLVDGVITVAAGPCFIDADCDDGNLCTTDTCIDGVCRHSLAEGTCGSVPAVGHAALALFAALLVVVGAGVVARRGRVGIGVRREETNPTDPK